MANLTDQQQRAAADADAKVTAAETKFEEAQRAYEVLPRNSARATRVNALHVWNNAARDFFTACTTAFHLPGTQYSSDAGYAADWLNRVVVHYGRVKAEADSLPPLPFDSLKPNLVKFEDWQRLVRETDPRVATDLRRAFEAIGLPVYGFDERLTRTDDITREREARAEERERERDAENRARERRWFWFGCFMFVVATGMGIWGFYLEELSQSRRTILLFFFPLAAGFAAGGFTGSMVTEGKLFKQLAVTATGGFGVFVLVLIALRPGPLPPPPPPPTPSQSPFAPTPTPTSAPTATPTPTPPLVNVEYVFLGGTKTRNDGAHSGCTCGDGRIVFEGPYSARVNQVFRIFYDASTLCRGQGFAGFSGWISWGSQQTRLKFNGQNPEFPGIAGILDVTFSRAGDYNVIAELAATCIDTGAANCRNECRASGTTEIHVK